MIEPGEEAPDFSAPDDDGNTVRLMTLRGRPVVLHFFSVAWSGACASELVRLGELSADFERAGAEVLGISCDSRLTLAAWKKAMGYPTRLLSDFWPHGEIGRRYGVFDERLGVHARGTFVVDRDGVVRWTVRSPELTQPRDVAAYLEALRSL